MGIGDVKLHLHRAVRGEPRALSVKREGRRWFVSIRSVDVEPTPLGATGREVGLDLGIVNLVATSDGQLVDAARFGRRAAGRLAIAQQDLARKRRGSSRRRRAVERVTEQHRRVRSQRATSPTSSRASWSTTTT